MNDYQNVMITKVNRFAPTVQRWNNGKYETALNWCDLANEAMRAIEPEVRQRWNLYWKSAAARAAIVQNAVDVNEMMNLPERPSGYYACPPELAAKAIWPTTNAAPALQIEGSLA